MRELESRIYRKRIEGVCSEVGVDLLSQVSDRMRQNVLRLCQGRLKSRIRRRFFTGRVFKHWNRLPRDGWNHHPWECSENVWLWHLGTWFSGEHCTPGLIWSWSWRAFAALGVLWRGWMQSWSTGTEAWAVVLQEHWINCISVSSWVQKTIPAPLPWAHTTAAEGLLVPRGKKKKLFMSCLPAQDIFIWAGKQALNQLPVIVMKYMFNSITWCCTFLRLTLQIPMIWRKDVCLWDF